MIDHRAYIDQIRGVNKKKIRIYLRRDIGNKVYLDLKLFGFVKCRIAHLSEIIQLVGTPSTAKELF